MDPILPVLSILGYWAIILGFLEVQVEGNVKQPRIDSIAALSSIGGAPLASCIDPRVFLWAPIWYMVYNGYVSD